MRHRPHGRTRAFGVQACIHPDVSVTFPDASRNWDGVKTARTKFEGMFQALPNFNASFSVESSEACRVVLNAHFTAEAYDQKRKMVYGLTDKLIRCIDHIDV